MEKFNSEQDISDALWNNNKSFCYAKISISEDKDDAFIDFLSKNANAKVLESVASMIDSEKNPLLKYGRAVLASTGLNKNDDYFLPEELWSARLTPVNVPYNNEHVKNDIIGHVFASYAFDKDGNEIDIKSDEYLENFDIAVDFVLYEHIYPSLTKELIALASKNETFVSMECKFSNFDYCLINSNGTLNKIIKRNKDTAFLTKKLRIYEGNGTYEGKKLCRVLRNFAFSGMANVEKPANKDSKYQKIEDFVEANCNINIDNTLNKSSSLFYIVEGNIMKLENLEQAEKYIAELSDKIATLEKEKNESVASQKINALETEKNSISEQLKAANTKIELSDAENTKNLEKIKELETSLASTKEELDKKTQALDVINKEAKAKERFAKLTELGYDIKDENRKKDIETMSDETFASVIAFVELRKPQEDAGKIDETNKDEAKAGEALDKATEKKNDGVEDEKVNEAVASESKKIAERFASALRAKKNSKK